MLNTIKNSDDAFASLYIKTAKASEQLKCGTNLMTINKKISTISEIAFFHIHSRITVPVGKEYPLEIILNPGFFLPKETQAEMILDETDPELETTLAALKEFDHSNEKINKTSASTRKRKQRKYSDAEGDELDDEDSSITSGTSVSLNNLKTKANVLLQTKKPTPNSSISSISSSAKSSPAKVAQKFDTPPISKKKKVDSKPIVLLSSESSRESSPVIKLIKPTLEEKVNNSNSEIIITKIPMSADEKKADAVRSRAARASNRQAKVEVVQKSEENVKKGGKKSIKEESEEDGEVEEKEDVDEKVVEKETKNKLSSKHEKQKKKDDKDEEEEVEDDDKKVQQDDSDVTKTPSSDVGVYTLRLRNRK
jgi:hypothetical protein